MRELDQVLSDSTSNIQRRYRHLFALPARTRTIAYASIIALGTTVAARIALRIAPLELLFYLLLTEGALLLSIEIDRRVLERKTRVATFRRLTSISIVSGALWLALSIIGVIVLLFTGSDSKLVSLVILGAFFAIAIRALLIGSLFYTRPWHGLPLGFVQPAILVLPTVYSPESFTSKTILSTPEPLVAVFGGLVAILAIEVYVYSINRVSRMGNLKPLDLLQAFLDAWAAEDATNLERFLDVVSKDGVVNSQMISIQSTSAGEKSEPKNALIVVPGPHPGPFYPIGSSNLPFDIYSKLVSAKLVPIVVHSISDHDLNLPSKRQVERYVSTLSSASSKIDSGSLMSSPVTRKINKATVNGISFGSTALLTITQAPHGMEDFPIEVKTEIESYSGRLGFRNILLIDTHNSEGSKPDEKECADAVEASKQVLDALTISKMHGFKAGVAHSSELGIKTERDIGPAGIDLVLFEIPETLESFSLVVADANNSIIGFRERVMEGFERNTGSKLLEICTSDTHVTAAKTMDAKGYLALGDLTIPPKFTEMIAMLYTRAKERISLASFSSSIVKSQVKTIGGEVLNNFSGLLDSASSVARNGAEVLAMLTIAITLVVALV